MRRHSAVAPGLVLPLLSLILLSSKSIITPASAQVCTGSGDDPYATGTHVPCCSWLDECLDDHHYRCYECCADPHDVDCSGPWTPPDPPRTAPAAKRGVSYKEMHTADLATLGAYNIASWGYTWQVTPDQATLDDWDGAGIDFVPMVWGASHTDSAEYTNAPYNAQALLGFNEPNFPDQANLLPETAADLWPRLQSEATAKGIPVIVSPAMNFHDYDPIVWLDEFFERCIGCRVDAIGIHSYTCHVEYLHDHLSKYYKYDRPLWLTEFACEDDPSRRDAAGQAEYMKEAIPYLESSPNVAKYAWFSYDFGTNGENEAALFNSGGLTPLGRLYGDLEGSTTPVPVPPACTTYGLDPNAPGENGVCCPGLASCLDDHYNTDTWHYRCYTDTCVNSSASRPSTQLSFLAFFLAFFFVP